MREEVAAATMHCSSLPHPAAVVNPSLSQCQRRRSRNRSSRSISSRGLKDAFELPSVTEAFASPEVQGLGATVSMWKRQTLIPGGRGGIFVLKRLPTKP